MFWFMIDDLLVLDAIFFEVERSGIGSFKEEHLTPECDISWTHCNLYAYFG